MTIIVDIAITYYQVHRFAITYTPLFDEASAWSHKSFKHARLHLSLPFLPIRVASNYAHLKFLYHV